MNDRTRRFEAAALPHLPAAYNLARWLLRDDQQAEDAVQEACLRAFRFFDNLRGEDARPWLLGIVRNACYDWMRQHRHLADQVEFDELRDSSVDEPGIGSSPPGGGDPAALWEQRATGQRVDAAIEALAPAFREVIVLRELEDLSYEDIARIAGIPIGTVMSRLSRARALLRAALGAEAPRAQVGGKRDASN
ncbi:sigma-70 family RNA polymerase sigma factor [Variovorax sp. J22P240]|uniref:sigma-70 family RNA polymerase sigma factor n=1 Tax=Variovorax sp. J22P240 TaxID=3053514 RepID=UPI002576365D|nr:sigma-70 family RNA polymerase sigma factor [Variovorax sp. J22P240]MDM0001700.1 sigma-70 family RNA polymerase sigma factor [Variovorax sp. J22P240]